ncbi:xylulokinase [Phototrophicus methaneseepsis]|uniref:Xylulose kinase n=1 Tax=Phototrophicus methaneseepsis TaxID=2710758 RepID=A0A7S8E6R9_9CHLR|nr:xylulokinase [Phototrophicus methaneseepsis]QPC81364.1 xylulokinase [Phototrophicus methaneseepsis]
MDQFIGIDIGTSSAKVTLVDVTTGVIKATTHADYPVYHPEPGHAEQNPDDWWHAVIDCLRQLQQSYSLKEVAGIGLTGQMHGTVFLGADKKPAYPAIIWADQRSAPILPHIQDVIGIEPYVRIAGTRPVAGFMVSTLAWLAQNQPQILENSAYVLLPKDYIRLKLTGTIGTDITDASATGLFDVLHETWSQEVISKLGLPGDKLASVSASGQVIGRITPLAAEACGLAAGIPVIAGCADQPAQAVANGIVSTQNVSLTIGSGGQIFVPTILSNRPVPDARLHFFNHAVPGFAYALGAILSAGLSLHWLRDLFGLGDYATLAAAAETTPPGAEGLIFLPYLYGERTPYMDAQARGAFIGLTHRHSQAHMARAVIEGVCFALRQTLEIALKQRQDAKPPTLIGSGGALSQPIWQTILTDILGQPLQVSQIQEQTSTGAALLASIGTGTFADFDQATAAMSRPSQPIEPNFAHYERYQTRYEQFSNLYSTLKDDFHKLD